MSYIPLTHHSKPPNRRVHNNSRVQEFLRYHKVRMLKEHPYCAYCDKPLNNRTATLDHIKPKSKGGHNGPSNLALACKPCNQTKGDKYVELR